METRQGLPRLVQLFPEDNSIGDTTVDIIAVHGIETQSPRTWVAYEHDREPRGRATNWLCDGNMLPMELPQARIWVYNYNSNCYSDNAQEVDILGLGDTFLEILRGAQDKGVGERMMIFIGSCFGGIVIAQALARAPRDEYRSLLNSTAGVIFLGTPLRGTATASIAQWLVLLRGFIGKKTSAALLKSLEEKDNNLNNAIHDFAEIAIKNEIQIRCFYETQETQIARAVASGWIVNLFRSVKLVPKESACLDGHKRFPLDANHKMMNKFRGPTDGSFRLVSSSLKEIMSKARTRRDKRGKEDRKCLRNFITSNYQEDKDRNVRRVPGTCMWTLKHKAFLRWSQDSTASLLWVSADPGCGKSVLSRALVDEDLLKPNTPTTSVCYFFFKDDDSSRQNGANALCALLHQLYVKKPTLLRYAMTEFQNHGQHLRNMFNNLWDILEKSAADPDAGEIVCVLDALDECSKTAREKLIERMAHFYSSRDKCHTRLKFLATSRPYLDIERAFRSVIGDMRSISLKGEDESETISKEIDLVIHERVPRLCSARYPPLEPEVQNALILCLQKFEHRTYLWLHLTLDVIRDTLESTMPRLEHLVHRLPRTIEDAYEKILEKVNASGYAQEARSLLHIVVAAIRPLTLAETRIALAINEKLECEEPYRSYDNLEYQSEEAFRVKIRAMCGLFVSIVDSRVYLIHQTAKEFLVSENLNNKSTSLAEPALGVWKHSLMPAESNIIILKICLYVLRREISHELILMEYAAQNWDAHFQCARFKMDESILHSTLDICRPQSHLLPRWWWRHPRCRMVSKANEYWTSLTVASIIGLETFIEFLLKKTNVEPNAQDCYGRTALHFAATYGQPEVVKLLVETDGIHLNLQDDCSRTALYFAATYARSIDENGIELDLVDEESQMPLSSAEKRRKLEVLRLLLKKGADMNLGDNRGRTPLSIAAGMGLSEVAKVLVEEDGIDLDLKDRDGRTPLSWAAMQGRFEVVELLLQKKPNLHIKDTYGVTALWYAVEYGDSKMVRSMLEKNAKLDPVMIGYQTASWWAALHVQLDGPIATRKRKRHS